MDARALAAYDRPVPRYTSYPTAAQFDVSVGPTQHRGWLGDLAGETATMYLHVPYCRRLCWYCACNTTAVNRAQSLDVYAEALLSELRSVAATTPDLVVGAVQWGGGTPSQLGPRRIAEVAQRLAASFDRLSGAEMSMEVDPRFCDDELVSTMKEIGVNRASLGVQDFDIEVQRAINRLQSVEDTASAIDRLKAGGIRRINIDLVYGLPLQTPARLARTLQAAVELGPDRFAVFGYAHVPWMKARQRLINAADLPAAEVRAEMAALVARTLVDAGYVRVGLDHYARPHDPLATAMARGQLRRSFQGYVVDESPWVVGLGASAISSLPRGFTQNAADATRYGALVASLGLATVRGMELCEDDRLRGEVIGRLMCSYTADIAELCRRHDVAVERFLAGVPGLPSLVEDGLADVEDGKLIVTERGRPLVRFVCAAFDRHFVAAAGRHSSGI